MAKEYKVYFGGNENVLKLVVMTKKKKGKKRKLIVMMNEKLSQIATMY